MFAIKYRNNSYLKFINKNDFNQNNFYFINFILFYFDLMLEINFYYKRLKANYIEIKFYLKIYIINLDYIVNNIFWSPFNYFKFGDKFKLGVPSLILVILKFFWGSPSPQFHCGTHAQLSFGNLP